VINLAKVIEKVTLTIDGQQIEAEKGIPVLLAAERAGIAIPHLCYYEGLSVYAGCRVCVVEIEGARGLPTSCTTLVAEGMVVRTKKDNVLDMQRGVMSLILADHPDRCLTCHRQEHCGMDGICLRDAVVTYRCLTCAKNKRCEFQSTSEEMEMHKYPARYYQESSSWYGPDHVEKPIKRTNPFIELDFNECILCARCVRACDEIRGLNCYEVSNKGPLAEINTAFSLPLQDVGCDACGACIDVCPVACILDRPSKWMGAAKEIVTTTCVQCGDGCQINLELKNGKIMRVTPDKDGPANHGQGCARGRFGLGFVSDPKRITEPMVRKNGVLVETTWQEAMETAAKALANYKGPAFGAVVSTKNTNEQNYLIQKLTRRVMGSPNIDYYTKFDDPATVAPLAEMLGYPAMTNSMDDIGEAACIFVMGGDTQVTHPIASWQARTDARYRGGKLIYAGPRWTEMCKWADLWLRYNPGTEVALLGGILRALLDQGLQNNDFIGARCEGLDELRSSLSAYELAKVAEVTGVDEEQIVEAARIYATSGPASILYDVGLIRFASDGAEAIRALVNMALLTGNIGVDGAGISVLRGASNQQGTQDMGCTPDYLPGYQGLYDNQRGLSWSQMIETAATGTLKAMYISGENPVLGDPNREDIQNALGSLEFLVVEDSFLTDTAQMAHVVLPSVTFAEEDGTFTNTERRVQRVHQALDVPGKAAQGWQLVSQLAQFMGAIDFNYNAPSQVMDEIAQAAPIYAGISHDRLEEEGIQWPCPSSDHPGTRVLYADSFPVGKARLHPLGEIVQPPAPTADRPLLLSAGLDLFRYDREVMYNLNGGPASILDEELFKLHPNDAAALGLSEDSLLRITADDLAVEVKALITDDVPEGAPYLTFPVLEASEDLMSSPKADIIKMLSSLNLKRVKLEKIQ